MGAAPDGPQETRPRGWFVDIDTDAEGDYRWQPCLQLDGWGLAFDVWFESEQDCLQFIADEVIGQGMLDNGAA